MEKRDALKVWTIFLAILAFSFSLLGTFLVRSGVLTSVHAFASDPQPRRVHPRHPRRVHRRLAGLFAWRAPTLQAGRPVRADLARGRAGAQQSAADDGCAMVFFGTLYPLGAGAIHRREDHRRRAVLQHDRGRAAAGAGLRHAVRLLAGLEARRPARRRAAPVRRLRRRLRRLRRAAGIARGGPVLAPIAAALAVFVILGSLAEVVARVWRRGASPAWP